MSHNTHKLVVSGVEALTVRTVQLLIIKFDLVLFESKFCCDTGQLGLFFFGFFFHLDILILVGEVTIVLFFSLLGLKLTTAIQRLLELIGAKFPNV